MKRYQLNRFRRGKKTSSVPNWMGSRKFPKIAGIAGMTKRKIMMTPCSVNMELYISGPIMVRPWVMSSVLISRPRIMANTNQKKTAPRYIRPSRL